MSNFEIIEFDGSGDMKEKAIKMLNDLSSRAKVIKWEVITLATHSSKYEESDEELDEEMDEELDRMIFYHYAILIEYDKSVTATN